MTRPTDPMSMDQIQAVTTDACCDACAARTARPADTDRASLISLERDSGSMVARTVDRWITVAGIAIAVLHVAALQFGSAIGLSLALATCVGWNLSLWWLGRRKAVS